MRRAGRGRRFVVPVTSQRYPSHGSRRTLASEGSTPNDKPNEKETSSGSSFRFSRDRPPHPASISQGSTPPPPQSSPRVSNYPPSQPRHLIPSSSSSLATSLTYCSSSPPLVLPDGWTSLQGSTLSPEIANIFATVHQRISASYEEEVEERLDPSSEQWREDDDSFPGRITENALVRALDTPGGDEAVNEAYGGLPIASGSRTSTTPEMETTQESRRGSGDGSRAYLEFLSQPGSEDRPESVFGGTIQKMELASVVKELERKERSSRSTATTLEAWEPFASSSSASEPVRNPAREDLPAWSNPSLPTASPSPPTVRGSWSARDPRLDRNTKVVVSPPDSFTSLPTLPWSPSPSPTDLVVPPRPSSYLNSLKSRDDAPWLEDSTHSEYRRLNSNLDDLSTLHPSLVSQQTLLLLLDEFLPLADFKGERRQETLEKLFACGLVPSRALAQTLLRATARWRDDLVGTRAEMEGIMEQMEDAGVKETQEEKIETLALLERVCLQNGNIVAANETKAQLYSLTPTPPRPTDLLLRLMTTAKVTLTQILSFVSELNTSGQIVPDEALELLVRHAPLDVWTFQGFVDVTSFVEEETHRTLTPAAWVILMERGLAERPERGPRGWLPGAKKVARVDLDVILRVFRLIQNPSPASVSAGIKLISGVATHPAPLDERLSTIQEVYKSVLDQLVGSSSPLSPSLNIDDDFSLSLSLSSSSTSISLPSDNLNQLQTLFDTTIKSLLDGDVPFTLPVASFLSQVHTDQRRLLGYSNWLNQILNPLRDPPYPLSSKNLSSLYSILLVAFPEEMKPVEIYWSFLSQTGRTIRSEPLTTTKAVLSIVQARLKSGENAFAGKTMLELVETLKTELWRAEAVRRRAGGKTKSESLDRSPTRGLLAIESVALEMDPRSLSSEFWNSLVEATSFSMDAQSAAWKVLVEVYLESINENAIFLRFRATGESKNSTEVFAAWDVVQQRSLSTPPSPLLWNAWLEALLQVGEYDRFVQEIVNKSPTPATDELLRWALDRLHDSSPLPSPSPSPTTLSSLSLDSDPIPRAIEILPPSSVSMLETRRLLELKETLREEFGGRWDRVEEERKLESSKTNLHAVELSSSRPTNISLRIEQKVESDPSVDLASSKNLRNAERKELVKKCLHSRGVYPSHPAFPSLLNTLHHLTDLSLNEGSYLDLRAMFLPSFSSPSPPISLPSLRNLIHAHLDILNVNKETSYIEPRVLRPSSFSPARRPEIKIEDKGGFGMKSEPSLPRSWKSAPKKEREGTTHLLDFEYKDVQW